MSSEAKRSIVRVLSNYGRLITTLVMGLLLVRVLLRAVGDEAFGLIMFLGSSVGLTAMLRDIVNRSLIRELGEASHGDRLPVVFNAALAVALVVGLITFGLFGVLAAALALFEKIPDELMFAARMFVLAKAVETFVSVLMAPYFNSYLVTERMVAYNGWRVADRASVLIAALILVAVGVHDPARAIIWYGMMTAGLVALVQTAAAAVLIGLDRRYLPNPRLASLRQALAICRVSGWNAAQVAATSAHARIDALLMFYWMGPLGGRLFGVAFQLTSYIRQTAVGMTQGLDAVATRMAVTEDAHKINRLTDDSTRFNAAVVLPAMIGVALLASALVEVWVGDRLGEPETEIPMIAALIRVFIVGVAARSICDGWVAIFYGAGHVRRFAPAIVLGAVANPLIAAALWFTMPDANAYLAPAIAFSISLTAAHLIAVPALAAKPFGIKPWRLFTPIVRPAIVSGLTLPTLLAAEYWIDDWSLKSLMAVIAGYGLMVVILTWAIVFKAQERRRLVNAAAQKIGRGQKPAPLS